MCSPKGQCAQRTMSRIGFCSKSVEANVPLLSWTPLTLSPLTLAKRNAGKGVPRASIVEAVRAIAALPIQTVSLRLALDGLAGCGRPCCPPASSSASRAAGCRLNRQVGGSCGFSGLPPPPAAPPSRGCAPGPRTSAPSLVALPPCASAPGPASGHGLCSYACRGSGSSPHRVVYWGVPGPDQGLVEPTVCRR